ncbi:hypothetical protein ACLH2B_13130 [Klebsiella sp. 2HUBk32mer]|uniref:Uncharacterized protein n=1 Tax=Buttiauxella agrestis TaxID=82977 RepID=A0A381C3F1_9ENTR|nr:MULTISPECIES: hypothetical protein [Enterobacteriaceae]ELT9745130.1 hypothetical protein [Klebsiella michiganensis]MCY0831475.1 hypothetical protein [Klebsiella michiganensis]MDD7824412.1 hypothetical protein [Klebsiella michiganensis]MDD7855506.1 hypothetical protein [Klebsiella michiganensis]TXV02511.1 hypothetical protein D4M92_20270 [Klebsiella michiganensis]
MQLKILGVGNALLLSVSVKTLDDAGILNISGLCRKLNVKRSTFLSKVASVGLEKSIIYYAAIKKQRDVLATLSEKDAAAFLAACNVGNNNTNNATH